MDKINYRYQFRTVLIIEILIVGLCSFFAYFFWSRFCNTGLEYCFRNPDGVHTVSYLALSILRPLTFFPMTLFSVMGIKAFGPGAGTVMVFLSAIFSVSLIYTFGKVIGKKLVNPWLSSNLPQTLNFLRSQDWKIVVLLRLIPFLPFDFLSFLFGITDLRYKHVLLATLVGIIPELYVATQLADSESSVLGVTLVTYSLLCGALIIPGAIFEIFSRTRGSSLFVRLKAMYDEILYEIQLNNDIVKRRSYMETKAPVLLLYGFFSSRRTLNVLERLLTAKGYEVLSFNLGGLFGVFFTKGIKETAAFIDFKLKRQFERHGFSKIKVVAHSKGGLVALWWLLKMGGSQYCDRVVTLGTPFQGSKFAWLALVTPLGFFWRDVWQMRPGSYFLKDLAGCEVPDNVEIYCLYSKKDGVAPGKSAIFQPNEGSDKITAIPMHHAAHYEFLYKRDVVNIVANCLGTPEKKLE